MAGSLIVGTALIVVAALTLIADPKALVGVFGVVSGATFSYQGARTEMAARWWRNYEAEQTQRRPPTGHLDSLLSHDHSLSE